MAAGNPFLLFSWNIPFLPALKEAIEDMTAGKPGSALVIAPNKRPWRYLVELFRQEKKTLALPRMLPFADVASLWRISCAGMPRRSVNILDQVALLRECVARASAGEPDLAGRLAAMDTVEFLPWGLRLAALLEELLQHGLRARDIPAAEDDVPDPAARLLGALGRIDKIWREMLEERNWTTPGFDNYLAAAGAGRIPEVLRPRPNRPVFIAGFSFLNGVQNILFRQLWQAGAHVCIHGDPALVGEKSPDAACAHLQDWLRDWHAPVKAVGRGEPDKRPAYYFYAAYDAHSQLARMALDLDAIENQDESAAIILPSANLLMPTLHELPAREVNISMGYPLTRAPLSSLLELLFRPRRHGAGQLYWRDAIRLVSEPFWGMLEVGESAREEGGTLKAPLARLAARFRAGSRYVDIKEEFAEVARSLPDKLARLLLESYEVFFEIPSRARTLGDMARAIDGICSLLLGHGQTLLRAFPLDAEALARLREGIIPVLRHNQLADESLTPETLASVLKTLLNEERIAFEADPIVGLQVLGMLEARLLHFDHLFILDASDDMLPGSTPQDPLLPDSLRSYLGLPDAATRHAVVGYNLFRLCASARDVHFYWTEGATPSTLGSSKKYRSRFVEQLIWRIESQQSGALLKPGAGNFQAALSAARSCKRTPRPLHRGQRMDAAMRRLLAGNLSATLLKSYLACPLRFALAKFLQIKSPVSVNEGDNPVLVGECAHRALEIFFVARKGFPIMEIVSAWSELRAAWEEACLEKGLAAQLPAASALAVEAAAPGRLKNYLDKFPLGATVVECERRERIRMPFNSGLYSFEARFDRVDSRPDGYHVLDYKTGRVPAIRAGLWRDEDFFQRLDQYRQAHDLWDEEGDELFDTLREWLPDPQLPLYALIGAEIYGEGLANAEIVELREKGREIALFDAEADDRELSLRHCRSAIGFILAHMENAPVFRPCQDVRKCQYCEMRANCF